MEHINIEIKGNVIRYAQLTAEQGYCFYDLDEEQRYYLTSIATPILDESELQRKFVAVLGYADVLNKQLEKEREELEQN